MDTIHPGVSSQQSGGLIFFFFNLPAGISWDLPYLSAAKGFCREFKGTGQSGLVVWSLKVCVRNRLKSPVPLTVDWGGRAEWDADIF